MNAVNLVEGIGLVGIGVWLVVVQIKNFIDGKPNTLGGISGLFIIGIGCVICGLILIGKQIW